MSTETLAAPQVTPTATLLRVLGIVSAVCGLIIVGSYEITLPAANANRRIALERAVFKVVPTAKSIVEYYALPAGGIEHGYGYLQPAADFFGAQGAFYRRHFNALRFRLVYVEHQLRPRLLTLRPYTSEGRAFRRQAERHEHEDRKQNQAGEIYRRFG